MGLILKSLDPGVNLHGRPDALAPIHICFDQGLDAGAAVGFIDAEHMGAALGGSEGDQGASVLLPLQSRQMLLPVWGAFLQGVVAVGAPENKTHGW